MKDCHMTLKSCTTVTREPNGPFLLKKRPCSWTSTHMEGQCRYRNTHSPFNLWLHRILLWSVLIGVIMKSQSQVQTQYHVNVSCRRMRLALCGLPLNKFFVFHNHCVENGTLSSAPVLVCLLIHSSVFSSFG